MRNAAGDVYASADRAVRVPVPIPEAEHEDALRKVGYSKERRVDPQVVVGLLVDRNGFPLEIGCFEGDKAEKHTILPVIRQFQARHGIEAVVVVAGMLPAANLDDLDEEGPGFIVGSRVTKAPVDLESHFRWHGDAFTDGQVIDTLTPKKGFEAHAIRQGKGDPDLLGQASAIMADPEPHMAKLPTIDQPALDGMPWWREWMEHSGRDRFWSEMSPGEHFSEITTPALHIVGWFDYFAPEVTRSFTRMRAEAATAQAREGQRLLIGPWDHGWADGVYAERDFGPSANETAADLMGHHLRFFDQHLRGNTAALEGTAPVSLVLHASSSARDTDFTGKLVDVFPDGRALYLTDGILRARYRNSLAEPELLEPGQVYELTVGLGPTSNVFLTGHRIRLEVSSSNFPRYDRNTNTGGAIAHDTADDAAVAVNRVRHGPGHPSRLILPVIRR